MKVIKIIGKIFGVLTVVIAGGLLCIYLIYDEELPLGDQSDKADALAKKMLNAINHEAYKNTRYLEWTFAGLRHYKWDKQQQLVDVSWAEHVVHLNIQEPQKSTVLVNDKEVLDASKSKIIEKVIAYFNNDSFWLVAPHKAFDPGTERRIISQDNEDSALLITYTSGGNTPGDSYLWHLGENGIPKEFKMWVSIFPLEDLEPRGRNGKPPKAEHCYPPNTRCYFMS